MDAQGVRPVWLRWWMVVGVGWMVLLSLGPVAAQELPAPGTAAVEGAVVPQSLVLNQRKIVTFRAPLLGDSPADRVELAQLALQPALQGSGPAVVSRVSLGDSVRLEVNGQAVFFLQAADLGGARPANLLDAASRDVQIRLQTALDEAREMHDPRQWLQGLGLSLLASGLAYAVVRLLWAARRRLTARVHEAMADHGQASGLGRWLSDYLGHARAATRWASMALTWVLVLLLVDAWATFVLHQFAYTRAWGERSTAWLLGVLGQFASAIASAVPGLLIAGFIFLMARIMSRLTTGLLRRVEQGELSLPWLDADMAEPTRRLLTVLVWLFALAMAYPYLPGANSEAFKGLSVLAGLMLSLGASSVVGQGLSGLSLMYSRSLRVGEYVKLGETEGTVVALGLFTTKIHTGMGEEVSLPNSVVFSQPIRNFSRLVQDGQFVMHTAVTIGYNTPWRQVHAMLLEAAHRTPGVATEPAPYVVQTALSDFYVEYRLCAQGNKNAPRRRAEAMNALLANIQDVFNENGVQIMSPHYMADPPESQVVPPGPWASTTHPQALVSEKNEKI